jgi:SAM-dependent methyltransferase
MERMPEEMLDHYGRDFDEDQRITQGLGQLELERTREIVRRHLPAGPLRVIDVGGATGVHAAWLAGDGHRVHVVDAVPRHVEQARQRAPRRGGITAELGDARQLAAADASFDAALLLGPLYHLTERGDRVQALSEAGRVVRPGGAVFVAAISRFASLFDGLSKEALFDEDFLAVVRRDLHDGQHRNPLRLPKWFTTAYFHHPDGLRAEIGDAGLELVELVGVEGMAGWLLPLGERWDDPADRDRILWSARVIEAESSLLGLSPHLIAVARRPGPD